VVTGSTSQVEQPGHPSYPACACRPHVLHGSAHDPVPPATMPEGPSARGLDDL